MYHSLRGLVSPTLGGALLVVVLSLCAFADTHDQTPSTEQAVGGPQTSTDTDLTALGKDDLPVQPPKPAIVWLASHDPTTDHPQYFSELLFRELVRQAILITARDELCLSTRDVVLRETSLEKDAANQPDVLHVSTHGTADSKLNIKVWHGDGDQTKELWNKSIDLTTDPYEYYFPVVRAMEEASRRDMVDALKRAGYDGAPKSSDEAQPTPETLESLTQYSLTSQLLALRETHAQARSEGQSPQLIGVLARAYAHLGVMTQHYWNAMCKVFQARSLLYAERLVASQPNAAFPLWTRGYSRAWVGLPAAALADFTQAEQVSKKTGETIPDWVRIAELHCRYDVGALQTIANSDSHWSELARILAFLDRARGGSDADVIEFGEETIQQCPEAYSIYDRLCDFGGVAYGHTATVAGSSALRRHMPTRLKTLRGIPKEIARRLPTEAPAQGNVFQFFARDPSDGTFSDVPLRSAQALIESAASRDDRGEPSWTILGRMIQEEDFASSARRLHFLKQQLGVPVDDFVTAVLPNLRDHPYAGWVESLAIEKENDPKKYREALLSVRVGDLYWREYEFANAAYSIPLANHETGAELGRLIYRRLDLIAPDLETVLSWYGNNADLINEFTKLHLPVTPYSPAVIAAMAHHAEADKAQLETWERDFGQHTQVLNALAQRHIAKKAFGDAERCLKKRIEFSADLKGYEQLAEVYRQQGDDEKWIAMLEKSLEFPDYGLSHASIQVRIAKHFMSKRQYAEARPYAEQAAQTWAGWAMSCASECLEALHEWDASEEWVKNETWRYPSTRLLWYFWCRRTGRGDVDAAKEVAQTLVDEYSARNPPAGQDHVGIFHLLNGDRKRAYEAFQSEQSQSRSYWSGFHVILLADEFGETDVRDRILNTFVKAGVPDPSSSIYTHAKFAVLLHDAYHGDKQELDLKALDEVLKGAAENQRMDTAYFAARFLALHGRPDDSVRYLKRCYASTEVSQLNRTLAGAELTDAGHSSDELQGPNDISE